jgi:hypothetical protein
VTWGQKGLLLQEAARLPRLLLATSKPRVLLLLLLMVMEVAMLVVVVVVVVGVLVLIEYLAAC